jgi:ribosomal protein S18 acetylase RimI-like enzyme
MKLSIVQLDNNNRKLVRPLFIDNWGSDVMITKGIKHNFDDLDGFVANRDDSIVGLITFKRSENEIEVISLNSFIENIGTGTALLNKMIDYAKNNTITRLFLSTTNDNLDALKFYQKRNWSICAFYRDTVTEARKIKPSIPVTGCFGIPLEHEIELEYNLE